MAQNTGHIGAHLTAANQKLDVRYLDAERHEVFDGGERQVGGFTADAANSQLRWRRRPAQIELRDSRPTQRAEKGPAIDEEARICTVDARRHRRAHIHHHDWRFCQPRERAGRARSRRDSHGEQEQPAERRALTRPAGEETSWCAGRRHEHPVNITRNGVPPEGNVIHSKSTRQPEPG